MNRSVVEIHSLLISALTSLKKEEIQKSLKKPIVFLDKRNADFFYWLVDTIDCGLDEIDGISSSFILLKNSTNDPQIRHKMLERVALPIITILVADLNRLDPTVIDLYIK